MTSDKIISVVEMYATRLAAKNVPKVRMDPRRYFRDLTDAERLAHAHYLCDGAKLYAKDSVQHDKANRHLTAIQMCLGFAGEYTLEELMEHNRTEMAPVRGQQFVQGITNFREPAGMT